MQTNDERIWFAITAHAAHAALATIAGRFWAWIVAAS
jgi:hypothetical protein